MVPGDHATGWHHHALDAAVSCRFKNVIRPNDIGRHHRGEVIPGVILDRQMNHDIHAFDSLAYRIRISNIANDLFLDLTIIGCGDAVKSAYVIAALRCQPAAYRTSHAAGRPGHQYPWGGHDGLLDRGVSSSLRFSGQVSCGS